VQVQNLEGLIHRNTVLCCVLLAPDLTYETHKPLQIYSTKKLGYAVIPCYKSTDWAYKLTMLAVQQSFDMSLELWGGDKAVSKCLLSTLQQQNISLRDNEYIPVYTYI
jgi:hypothetical protein